MSARWPTFLVWALVAASAVAWGLKLFVTAPGAPPQVAIAGQAQLPRGDVTRVLGADAPPPVDAAAGESLAGGSAEGRVQLLGVVAPRGNETARNGVALIAVDGKPAKAFRVGAVVFDDNVLQAVRARGADLGPMGGKVAVALNIPPPAAAATGTLPDARSGGGTATPAPAAGRPPAATTTPAAPIAPALPQRRPGPAGASAGVGAVVPVPLPAPVAPVPAPHAPVAPAAQAVQAQPAVPTPEPPSTAQPLLR
ncbi:MAG: hypothetical protein JNL85_06430 [Rubrivivax sp.]|nr:hypothetical protein [Rubrivivax sp.]